MCRGAARALASRPAHHYQTENELQRLRLPTTSFAVSGNRPCAVPCARVPTRAHVRQRRDLGFGGIATPKEPPPGFQPEAASEAMRLTGYYLFDDLRA